MKAVMYGAGNIGRGFIGQLLSQSGYEVSFVDVNQEVVGALNSEKKYPVDILYGDSTKEIWVENVSGVDGRSVEKVAQAIAEAQVMATAVGVNILKFIAEPIAAGLKKRWENGNDKPFNIIICENLIGADKYLKELIGKCMNDEENKKLNDTIGFVEASIGRMVPVQTAEMQNGNSLRVCVEAYDKLPLDVAAIKGEKPEIKNAVWYTPFEYYIERKLFIHNMGHATTAYLGRLKGYEYIWQAIEDNEIQLIVLKAMTESAIALSKRHNVEFSVVYDHVLDLINRFGNKQLGDTVQRVGNDLKRKLDANDRLVGAYNMCKEQGIDNSYIKVGIAAALSFGQEGLDLTAEELLKDVSKLDDAEIKEILGIAENLK